MITTDFNSATDQNKGNVLKDKESNTQLESIKGKGKVNYNNNRDDTDSIDDNCSSCRTNTNAKINMSTNNITKVNIINSKNYIVFYTLL